MVIAVDLVLEVVAVVLGCHGAVPLLCGLYHEVVLVHVLLEGPVAAGDDEDLQLGVGPLRELWALLHVGGLLALIGRRWRLELLLLRLLRHQLARRVDDALDEGDFNSVVSLMNHRAIVAEKDAVIDADVD